MKYLEYPNPQFRREQWESLNGEWSFCFDDQNEGLRTQSYKTGEFYDKLIQVPYSYNTVNSKVNNKKEHDIVWYKKKIVIKYNQEKKYILHFGAVDYKCDIWLNDEHIKEHRGGHVPFSIDISNWLKDENILIVRAEDKNLCIQPIGKQSWKDHNFLCWYSRTVGIWQEVWLEETGSLYLTDVRITPDIDNASIEIDAFVNQECESASLQTIVRFKEEIVADAEMLIRNNRIKFSLDVSSDNPNFRLHFWNPNEPNLYDIEFRVKEKNSISDTVNSYFGMRNIEKKDKAVYINNQMFYQKLILDQGYFKDGGMTATATELESDIAKIKEMGFNGVRKHQKIEDHRFMYLCDVYGLVMWAEMPSPFEYSIVSNENMVRELYGVIKKHYNHPSVIAYTLMNESWGINEIYHNKQQQAFVNGMYYLTKSLDTTRIVIGNDGWEHTKTDILTIHDYNGNVESLKESYQNLEVAVDASPSQISGRQCYCKGYAYDNVPVMISEYGGLAFTQNSVDGEEWGYGERLNNADDVVHNISELTKAIMNIGGICGFCYTQLSDVEQEVNGLLDEKHEYKFDPVKIREIMEYKYNVGYVFI